MRGARRLSQARARAFAPPMLTLWLRPVQPLPLLICVVILAEEVAAELAAKGTCGVLAIQADVTKPEQVQAMVRQVVDSWGELTIACNNAGIALRASERRWLT